MDAAAIGLLGCLPRASITMATTASESNVSAAIEMMAHDNPKRSAIRPAESAPIA